MAGPLDAGKRLDAFLHEKLPEFSRSRLQSWIKQNLVAVNGKPARASDLVKGSETVLVTPAAPPPLRAEAEDLPLKILKREPLRVLKFLKVLKCLAKAAKREGLAVLAELAELAELADLAIAWQRLTCHFGIPRAQAHRTW